MNQTATLPHLVTVYVARRALVPVLERELLDTEKELELEEAGILLDLFHARTRGQPTMKIDNQGFTTLKQIELAQMISQPQVHRRVTKLLASAGGYLELNSSRTSTGAMQVRLTEKGRTFAERFWAGYRGLASSLLAGMDDAQRQSHLSVNYAIQRKIQGWGLPWSAPAEKSEPAENLMSVFVTAKAIRLAIERSVILPEDGLSVERTDLLVVLYVTGRFTSFGEIQRSLVQSFSPSRHIISKWIGEMGPEKSGFVDTQPLHGKRMAAAITQKGIANVKPILDRYNRLADRLLDDVSEQDRKAHLLVNRTISNSIRPNLKDLITEEGEAP